VDRLDHPIAPVKSIPVEVSPITPAQPHNPYTSDALVARIESLPDGELIELPLPKGWTQPEFHRETCSLLRAAEDKLMERIKVTWRKPDMTTIIRREAEKPEPKPAKKAPKNYVCEGCGKKNENAKWPDGWARTAGKIWCEDCVSIEAWVKQKTPKIPDGFEIFDRSKTTPKEEPVVTSPPVVEEKSKPAPIELYARVAKAEIPIAPAPITTLPRAFEMVTKEVRAHRDSMIDMAKDDADDINWEAAIKEHNEVLGILHDCNPAFLGWSQSDGHPSIYERALQRANDELGILELEAQRVNQRITALRAIRDALQANHRAEEDTRA